MEPRPRVLIAGTSGCPQLLLCAQDPGTDCFFAIHAHSTVEGDDGIGHSLCSATETLPVFGAPTETLPQCPHHSSQFLQATLISLGLLGIHCHIPHHLIHSWCSVFAE